MCPAGCLPPGIAWLSVGSEVEQGGLRLWVSHCCRPQCRLHSLSHHMSQAHSWSQSPHTHVLALKAALLEPRLVGGMMHFTASRVLFSIETRRHRVSLCGGVLSSQVQRPDSPEERGGHSGWAGQSESGSAGHVPPESPTALMCRGAKHKDKHGGSQEEALKSYQTVNSRPRLLQRVEKMGNHAAGEGDTVSRRINPCIAVRWSLSSGF